MEKELNFTPLINSFQINHYFIVLCFTFNTSYFLHSPMNTKFSAIVICCTGLNTVDRDRCFQIVTNGSGSYRRDLCENVTHLIATSNTLSEKYKVFSHSHYCRPLLQDAFLLFILLGSMNVTVWESAIRWLRLKILLSSHSFPLSFALLDTV